ncbi:hypothetical protein [Sorangium sp. So ce388]|uniref:hypothetical protein n=1 Tax=Sorangium sp. So ce388 TaxID=3133309 RepID=UPI003F5C6D10
MLRRRAARIYDEQLDLSRPIPWESEEERQAAIAFFNAAFRALAGAYAEHLGRLFVHERDLDFAPPELLLRLFGHSRRSLAMSDHPSAVSVLSAEAGSTASASS